MQNPDQWLKDSANINTLSHLSGVPDEQIAELVKGNRYLPVNEQITQLGQPVDKAIKDTASFLKEQGKVDQVDADYGSYVTDKFVKAVQASPQS